MKDKLAPTVHAQRHPRKPILYWEAHKWCFWGGRTEMVCIDQNNSIAILRAKHGNDGIRYVAIR